MHRLENKIPPPVVGLFIATLMWLLAQTPWLHWQAGIQPVAAVCLLVIGLTFDIAGILSFCFARTTLNPLRPEKTRTLVTQGVYRYTRNPMYVGLVCLLLAWGIYLGSMLALLLVPLLMFYLERFQIRPEERTLQRLFGEAFDNYQQQVPRWL